MSDLYYAGFNAQGRIGWFCKDLDAAEAPDEIAKIMHQISWEHRAMAISWLIWDEDPQAYRKGLRRCGLAWLAMMRQVKEGSLPYVAAAMRGSRWFALTGAIAAWDLDLARELAEHAPTDWDEEREYEDDWLKYMAIIPLLRQDDPARIKTYRERWIAAQDGDAKGGPTILDGILAEDLKTFTRGLRSMVSRHRTNVKNYRKEIGHNREVAAVESKVAIEAIAYCQIGRLYGLEVTGDMPMMPAVARPAGPADPLEPDDWRNITR